MRGRSICKAFDIWRTCFTDFKLHISTQNHLLSPSSPTLSKTASILFPLLLLLKNCSRCRSLGYLQAIALIVYATQSTFSMSGILGSCQCLDPLLKNSERSQHPLSLLAAFASQTSTSDSEHYPTQPTPSRSLVKLEHRHPEFSIPEAGIKL